MFPAPRALALAASVLLAGPAAAATFTVVNTGDSVTGSLRWAIQQANAAPGPHRIVFNIPVSGVQTIHLLTPLPAIHFQTAVDGTTQPKYAGTPLIEVEGSGLAAFSDGIHFDSNASNSSLRGLTVNRFPSHAVWIDYAQACTLAANQIGVDAAGTAASANGGNGVIVTGNNHVIGGRLAGDRNVISGNAVAGIRIQGPSTCCAIVAGNTIGLNAAGAAAIPNLGQGVDVLDATQVVIGGPTVADRNVISGNGSHGVRIRNTAAVSFGDGAIVENNFIGTNGGGTSAVQNGADGLYLATSRALVGDVSSGNVISGNHNRGVYVEGPAGGFNDFFGNRIGSNASGGALGNGAEGIFLDDSGHNFIGSNLVDGSGNQIAANGGAGLRITGFDAINNVIQGNAIGTTFNGGSSLGNGAGGINSASDYTTIGGVGAQGNIIAYNALKGVMIGGLQSTIVGNSIFSNASIGIDLLDASGGPVTPNDTLDTDDGPNYFQNFPQILSVTYAANQVRIQGRYSSEPNSSYSIEFFSNRQCDPSGYGEGEAYLGSTDVNTNAFGVALFDVSFLNPPLVGLVFTATATDFIGDTSEFSACATLVAPVAVDPLAPAAFALGAAFPSPARGPATIPFTLPRPAHVTLEMFDVLGRTVATVLDDALPAGRHTATWRADGLASGVYLCRIQARAMDGSDARFAASRTLVVVK